MKRGRAIAIAVCSGLLLAGCAVEPMSGNVDAAATSDDLSVDLVRRLVKRGTEDIKLSPKEYDILEQLAIHAGKVLTHKHLLREVWRDESVDPQYLRIYVRQLRQKIEADPSTPRHVLTEPGIGYRLV